MRLENGPYRVAWEPLTGGLQRRFDFCRMMSIVVNDNGFFEFTHNLESLCHA